MILIMPYLRLAAIRSDEHGILELFWQQATSESDLQSDMLTLFQSTSWSKLNITRAWRTEHKTMALMAQNARSIVYETLTPKDSC